MSAHLDSAPRCLSEQSKNNSALAGQVVISYTEHSLQWSDGLDFQNHHGNILLVCHAWPGWRSFERTRFLRRSKCAQRLGTYWRHCCDAVCCQLGMQAGRLQRTVPGRTESLLLSAGDIWANRSVSPNDRHALQVVLTFLETSCCPV